MFVVCDSGMRVLSDWSSLAEAKAAAKVRSLEYAGQTFFVCDHTGCVLAGYTSGR
jgi:hypothetical protein